MVLTEAQAALIKGMLLRGDKQSDIAAWFGVNSGRVAEINKGHRFPKVQAAAWSLLPPPGPYRLTPLREPPPANGNGTVLSEFEQRLSGELAKMTHERRQTNEKIDLLMHQQRDLRILMGSLEKPQTPRIGRRRPLGS